MREASALSLHIQYSVHIFLNVCRPAGSRPTFWASIPASRFGFGHADLLLNLVTCLYYKFSYLPRMSIKFDPRSSAKLHPGAAHRRRAGAARAYSRGHRPRR